MNSEVSEQSKPDKRPTFNRLQLVFGLIFLPVFVSLGFWQLDRADLKELRQKEYDAAPRQLSDASEAERLLAGRLLQPIKSVISKTDARYFLLDNRTLEGRAGYEVMLPVQVGQGWMLANLGWVQANPDRRILPDLDLGQDERFEIEGVLSLPENLIQLTETMPEGTDWPLRIQSIDLQLFGKMLELPVEPILVKVYSQIDENIFPHKAALNSMPPERHIGYAVQWFGLAIAMFIWLVVSMFISRRES